MSEQQTAITNGKALSYTPVYTCSKQAALQFKKHFHDYTE